MQRKVWYPICVGSLSRPKGFLLEWMSAADMQRKVGYPIRVGSLSRPDGFLMEGMSASDMQRNVWYPICVGSLSKPNGFLLEGMSAMIVDHKYKHTATMCPRRGRRHQIRASTQPANQQTLV